jgi:class 3 adenylate cyclase/CHASE2 domain-containing sensor protein
VKLKPFKRIPALIAFGVILFLCLLRIWEEHSKPRPGDNRSGFDFADRLECMTYDMRARTALRFSPTTATNLGFVYINEESLQKVRTNAVGLRFGLLWPRQVYGRLVAELKAQQARAVALDVIFGELRPDHAAVEMANGGTMESDDFFATQMRQASNVIIAVTKEVIPPRLFLTNAAAVGHIVTDADSDGILRRVQAFRIYRHWHPALQQAQEQFGADLDAAQVEPDRIVIPVEGSEPAVIKLDADGNFDLTDLVGDKLPAGMPRKAKPFTPERVWHMGVVLAAMQLGLDLTNADVNLAQGSIALRGPGGMARTIPVDADGFFYIDWCLPPDHDPALTTEAIHDLLLQYKQRLDGQTEGLTNRWRDKLAVVGSSAVIGNNLTDRGATPLSKSTLLVSKHWNVANSLIVDRFIRRSSLAMDLALIAVMGILAAFLTWELKVLQASALVVLCIVSYVALGFLLYVNMRYWLPLVWPVVGGITTTHVCLVTWRVVFEEADKRRMKSIFSRIVSPNIVNELLAMDTLSLGGARREITVYFADVRGFTELTDSSQEKVAERVRKNNLTGEAAEACYDEQARETLATVNRYLGMIADVIKKQDGTLDKFIGDCVMAFWGAPTPNPKHAVACVRAAIEAQRAIYELNRSRTIYNQKLELENLARISAGLPVKAPLPILLLGSGINTGMATVGLMGSQSEQQNYTVFGREVNLASRLESASGRGRIFIGETTYAHLLRDDPSLAATCVELPLRDLKGFRAAVKAYEVPWRPPGADPFDEEITKTPGTESTTFTGFVQRGST